MLRTPIGNYKVGICALDTPEFGTPEYRRRLSLLCFYPAKKAGALDSHDSLDSAVVSSEFPYKDSQYQKECAKGITPHDNEIHTNCYEGLPLASDIDKYPVILYSHGLTGHQMESTVLCTDLASSGYIVISVGHPYGSGAVTYTDGTLFEPPVPYEINRRKLGPLGELWYEDTRQAINYTYECNRNEASWFYNRLDLRNGVNLLGVSFGGCVSVGAALTEEHIRCAINLDGGLFTEMTPRYQNRPILVMCSRMNITSYAKLLNIKYPLLTVDKIRKIIHWEFSDGIYLSDHGRQDPDWADRISKSRALRCIEFIENIKAANPSR